MLKTTVSTLKMKNPLMLASGICDLTKESLEKFAEAGAVITKSIGKKEREGYKNPVYCELQYGMLNAIGLANPGIDEYIKEIKNINIDNVIGNIFGGNKKEFTYVTKKFLPHVKAIELNLSCPHAKKVGMEYPTEDIKNTVELVKKEGIPVFVKLGVENIVNRAEQAIEGGADAIVAINSIKAMAINIEVGMPVLGNIIGGYSGAAIKPIGIRCVYELALQYNIPLIGVGGITKATDVIEYMMAGASAVQIGSGIYGKNEKIFTEICNDLTKWLEKKGYNNIKDIVGLAIRK